MNQSPPNRENDDDRPTYRLVRPIVPSTPQRPRGVVQESPPPQRVSPSTPPSPLRRLLVGKLPLETETSFFLLVNLIDFFVTYYLLMSGGRGNLRFVESNPAAQYFIDSWGPVKGMLGFKLGVVTFVCLLAQIIALKRLDLGRGVLLIGILATGAVVAYSLSLWLRHA